MNNKKSLKPPTRIPLRYQMLSKPFSPADFSVPGQNKATPQGLKQTSFVAVVVLLEKLGIPQKTMAVTGVPKIDGKPMHPTKLKMESKVERIMFLLNWVIFRFHVNFPGCVNQTHL